MLSTPWGPSRQGAPGSPCSRRSKTASSTARGSAPTNRGISRTWRAAELPGRFGDKRPTIGHELVWGSHQRLPRRPVPHCGVGRRKGAVTFRHHAQPRPDGAGPVVGVAGRAVSGTHPVCGMCCTQAVLLVPSPPLPTVGAQNLSQPRQKAQIFVDNIYCARKLPTKNRLTGGFPVLLLSTVAAVVSQDFGGLRGFLRVRCA